MSKRKEDHIHKTFDSQVERAKNYGLEYEPLMGKHPKKGDLYPVSLLGHHFDFPFLVFLHDWRSNSCSKNKSKYGQSGKAV
jgi:hypothetical protein